MRSPLAMPEPSYLRGACVWSGPEMAQNDRWLKPIPAIVQHQIAVALEQVRELAWRNITRLNFPLPGAADFFDEVREELELGCGMVKICGLDVTRYSEEQLRRIWFGIGCHLGTPMYQNCRGEMMRDIRDEGTE